MVENDPTRRLRGLPDVNPRELVPVILDQVLHHRGDVVVGITRLPFLRGQAADKRRPHRPANRLTVSIPAVKTHREQRLRTHQHPGDLRLRSPLSSRQKRPPIHATARLRVEAIGLDDERVELIVQFDRLADNVARTVTEVLLDVLDNLMSEGGELALVGSAAPRHGTP